MPKGKRYILVEVDVDVAVEGLLGDKLTDDSQQSFDSILAELERLSYADGTRVYGAIKLSEYSVQPEAITTLHQLACERSIGALGKECDRPGLEH